MWTVPFILIDPYIACFLGFGPPEEIRELKEEVFCLLGEESLLGVGVGKFLGLGEDKGIEEGLEPMNWMGWISRMASAVDDRMIGDAVTVLNYKIN